MHSPETKYKGKDNLDSEVDAAPDLMGDDRQNSEHQSITNDEKVVCTARFDEDKAVLNSNTSHSTLSLKAEVAICTLSPRAAHVTNTEMPMP